MAELAEEPGRASAETVLRLIEWRRYKEALSEAQKLLALYPEDPDAMALTGKIWMHMSRYDEALKWSGEALRRSPEHELAWFVRVASFYESGRMKEFEQALAEALRIDPYESFYYYMNANALNKKGKFKEAREELLRALELRPESPLYLATLSYVEALLGDYPASARLDRQAIRYDAEDPYVLLYLAWAARTRDDAALDESYMKSAIRLNPDEKQFQDEYLIALQRANPLFRIASAPGRVLRRMKPWQIFLSWAIAWLLFKPLIIVFIVLYVLANWGTKAFIHVKVFGWRRR